jgi:polyhydroxyalkanoate synthase
MPKNNDNNNPQATPQDPKMDLQAFTENMLAAGAIYNKVFSKMATNAEYSLSQSIAYPHHLGDLVGKVAQQFLADPKKIVDFNIQLTKDYVELYNNVMQRFLQSGRDESFGKGEKDSRFKDEAWDKNPIFNFIKQSYYLNSTWLHNIIKQVKALDKHDAHKLEFYTKQFIDSVAPTNFAMTNPEVIRQTLVSNGENLVRGAENILEDLEKSDGSLMISTANADAFKVGETLAATKGKVVFRNDLFELIQYEATTDKVHETPLIVMPAWINKYYILDLQQKNSFVKWIVDQGHNTFMISWVNPGAKLKNKDFEDYMKEGSLTALEQVRKITGCKQVNFMGYCLGGTLLASTLAYLKKKGGEFPVKSATFLTTLVDFTDSGDISVFMDEEQISYIEERMDEKGYLDGKDMARTFNMLRSNDMIWSFYVNNYLMGQEPFPFDILYWNSDSTRLPAKMHSFYLRNMYQDNLLCKPNAVSLDGMSIDLTKIDIPCYLLSTRSDHIAPWKSTYSATQIYSGKIRFVLSASGHVAGVVNHPSKEKYCYWTNDRLPNNPDEWLKEAKEHPGSWWTDWDQWQAKLAGEKVPARKIKDAIMDAPGKYVKMT